MLQQHFSIWDQARAKQELIFFHLLLFVFFVFVQSAELEVIYAKVLCAK